MTGLQDVSGVALQEILRRAPRRYRMPDLPAMLAQARGAGDDTVLAFAIESARLAKMQGREPDAALAGAFTDALAAVIRRAMDLETGDPAFQAQVLQARDAQVQAWVQLSAQAAGDERSVRMAVDAVAHPGKLRAMPEGPERQALQALHAQACAGEWHALASKVSSTGAPAGLGVQKLAASPALRRLLEARGLRSSDAVRQYLALRARHAPDAGSAAALDQGRASAREGELTERAAAAALAGVAAFLDARTSARHRVVQGLRTPGHLTGAGGEGAKEEWDAAILRQVGDGTEMLMLLAEAKAAPAAATNDLPRLLRGLAQLSAADPQAVHDFRSAGGALRLRGESLRALQPVEGALPAQVIYLCTAPAEARVPPLGAAARARLMAEAASLKFAIGVEAGAAPSAEELAPVWEAVLNEDCMRSVLAQYDTTRRAREAMLHPDDLQAAARED